MKFQKKIKQQPLAQHAESQLRRKRRIGVLHLRAKLGVQQIAGVGAFGFHAPQHVIRDFSGGTNGHR